MKYNTQQGFSTTLVLVVVAVLVVVGAVFYLTQQSETYVSEDKGVVVSPTSPAIFSNDQSPSEPINVDVGKGVWVGTILAGKSSPLLEFNKSDYDKAITSDKLIVLYFYANWCPLCAVETRTALYPAFDELNDVRVVGFRVNYNDNQTDDSERSLARQFGVAYQHTKVLFRNNSRLLKAPDSWNKDKYLTEINKVFTQSP
ncbi:thioredoxin family protein [Candidatus Jorgensenbacteria bacterium]|nr:thioredoxin family protein [Candidatus Jorgensenbacteria bacterium]